MAMFQYNPKQEGRTLLVVMIMHINKILGEILCPPWECWLEQE
jgi:hypothetical protein